MNTLSLRSPPHMTSSKTVRVPKRMAFSHTKVIQFVIVQKESELSLALPGLLEFSTISYAIGGSQRVPLLKSWCLPIPHPLFGKFSSLYDISTQRPYNNHQYSPYPSTLKLYSPATFLILSTSTVLDIYIYICM